MTQSEFFGAIESNLLQFAESRIPLPAYNLPGLLRDGERLRLIGKMVRLSSLRKLTDRDSSAPSCIRAYDLVSSRIPFSGRKRFRVFAAYSEEATEEAYRRAKFLVRKWYQESGWADAASERPFAGAMVIGSGHAWPEDLRPNADDRPFETVVFHVLAAPHERAECGMAVKTLGDANAGALIFRALIPETFEERAKRVSDYVAKLFRQESGTVTVERVADTTGVSPNDVSHIFNDLQAEGTVVIRKRNPKNHVGVLTEAARMYVEPGTASLWKRMVSKNHGAWYTQRGFCTLFSLGTGGCLVLLLTKGLEALLPEQILQYQWLLFLVGGFLVTGCLLFTIRSFVRRI